MSALLLSVLIDSLVFGGDPLPGLYADLNALAYHRQLGIEQPTPNNTTYQFAAINGFGIGYRFRGHWTLLADFSRTSSFRDDLPVHFAGERTNERGYRMSLRATFTTNFQKRFMLGVGIGPFIERSHINGVYITDAGPDPYFNVDHIRHYQGMILSTEVRYRLIEHVNLVWEAHLLSGSMRTKHANTMGSPYPLFHTYQEWATYLNPIGKLGLRITI